MEENRFSSFVPTLEDQHRIRQFYLENRAGPSTSAFRKRSLFGRLKQKMSNRGIDDRMEVEVGRFGWKKREYSYALKNKWARKRTRKIEVGWIHEGRQVRQRRGGGTRTINVPRDTRKAQLFNFAKDLFFPNGRNEMGKFEADKSDIVDFRGEPMIDDKVTVGEMYDLLKKGMLRFYLSTQKLQDADGNEEDKSDEGDREPDWGRSYEEMSDREERSPIEEEEDPDTLKVTIGDTELIHNAVTDQAEAEEMHTTSQHSECGSEWHN
ncbi:hypothetical protein WMY93_026247 [Mugilogobius chulae]|uniref:Uncharacterized protein n=1 Tax=Mugilogobius chulae TaxID=88201 RepID=A0AAW0N1Q8_9GOBI